MMKRPCHRRACLALAALSAVGMAASAAEIRVRLVDAATRTPLEYWEKTVEQSELKSTLYWRMPKVAVDGQPWAFGRQGGQDAGGLGAPGGQDDDVERLLAAPSTNAARRGEIRSDRAAEIGAGSGPKAVATGEVADGDHVVQPGSLRFRVERGMIVQADAPLQKDGADALRLPCLPVDVSLPAVAGDSIEVTWKSGEAVMFQGAIPAARPVGLRLYLPASEAGYTLKFGQFGSCRFALTNAGVRFLEPPQVAAGARLDAERLAIGLTVSEAPRPDAKKPGEDTSAGGGPELYLFTDRNRTTYVEGERVEISLRAWGGAADDGRVTLSLEQGGTALALAPQTLARAGDGRAAEVAIDTHSLRPGTYRLRARWAGVESNPLDVSIVPLMPDTNLKLFGFCKWIDSGYDPSALAPLARVGLNMVVAEGGGWNPYAPFSDWGRERAHAVTNGADRFGPHVPPELLEPRLEHDAGSEFLLANGIENLPIACGLILYFNVGEQWRSHADDRNQQVQHLGQEWRRFPNFRGIVHCTGDGPTPATMGAVWAAGAGSFDLIHGERVAKLREAFDFKVGKVKVDDAAIRAEFDRISGKMQGAIGFGVGMDTGLKIEGDDAIKFEWVRWLNDLYPDCFREERKALTPLVDGPLVTCSHTWGPGARSGMWEETFMRDLDNPLVDIRGDYGIMPMSYSSGSDVLCMGQRRRPWIVLDVLPERPLANGLKLFLEALSRNPAGIGFMNGGVAGGWSLQKEPGERMATLMNLARRFGDVFGGLERRDEVAVLASMRQDAVAEQSQAAVWGAHFLATKAGYQANVVTEEQCLREPETLSRFKAVFLVGMTAAMPAALRERLAAFQAGGGVVLADAATKCELPAIVRAPLADMIFANQVDFRAAYDRFEPLIEPFRGAVKSLSENPCRLLPAEDGGLQRPQPAGVEPAVPAGRADDPEGFRIGSRPKIAPFFESSARHVHLVRSVDADLEYWTLFNDTLQTAAECPGGHWAQFLYKGVEADLKAGRAGVLYDAFRRQPVETRNEGGTLAWRADLRHLPGTVYVCADRPIASLSVEAPRRAARNSVARLKAAALDGQGKTFAGKLPVEILVADPSGAVRYRLYRTTNRDVALKIAGNDPAGRWTWTVADQVSGLVAKGEWAVEGEPVVPSVKPLQDLVFDGWAIGAALREREFDVVLYPDQTALRGAADALAESLRAAGARVGVRVIGAANERTYPMNWKPFTVEDEEIESAVMSGGTVGLRVKGKNEQGNDKRDPMAHGFYRQFAASAERVLYRDAILIGRAGAPDNPLFRLVAQRTRMLPRNPSPGFPAPGYGFAAYAWGPFHYGHDAIVVYGADEKGLQRAAEALVALAKTPPARPAGAWRQADEWGQSFGAGGAAGSGERQTVVSSTRHAESLLPAIYDQRVLEARVDGNRLLLRQDTPGNPMGPVFAAVDLAAGTAKRFNSEAPVYRRASLDAFARGEGGRLAAPLILKTAAGRIMPVGRGVALLDERNALRWFYEPFSVSKTIEEAQYPRLCHRLALSKDGKTLAAGFYDLNAGGSYGPKYRQFNEAAVALIDVPTGREICRYAGYLANQLLLSDDGARCLVTDTADFERGRGRWNAHGGPTAAVFDRAGKELFALAAPEVSGAALSGNGRLAALAYGDTRGSVTVVDVDGGRTHDIAYARIDVGVAAAPDGSAAAIVYADGTLRKVSREGAVVGERKLAAPGVPVFMADGTLMVCGDDGKVYAPETARAEIAFGEAPVEMAGGDVESVPFGLTPPARPWWTGLPGGFVPEKLAPPAGFETGEVRGEKNVTVNVPAGDALDVTLFAFRYSLMGTQDMLTVSMPVGERKVSFLYPYHAEPRSVAVPIRRAAGPVTLTFAAPAGVRIDEPALLRLNMGRFGNGALAGLERRGSNLNTPRLVVPNIHGCLGDPREEQYAYVFPKGKFALPADVKEPAESDVLTVFDGRVYEAKPLYPTVYPGRASWDPVDARATLRSAQVVMEFAQPRTVAAVGVWEHPNGGPVAAFALEYAQKSKEPNGDWTLAVEGRDNTDYYHAHVLPKPVAARYWRYTVLETPCPVQRVAEIELYQPGVESLMEDGGALPEL